MPCATCSGDSSPPVLPPAGDLSGRFDQATLHAVASFQEVRGLRSDGRLRRADVAGDLIEAGWRLGDRVLCSTRRNCAATTSSACSRPEPPRLRLRSARRHPRTRHDPGARRFPAQLRASTPTACAGPPRSACSELLLRQSGSGPGVATDPRERGRVIGASTFGRCASSIGQFGGLSAITRALARVAPQRRRDRDVDRRVRGECPRGGRQPVRCHRLRRFRSRSRSPVRRSAYFAVPQFESFGGRALADEPRHRARRCRPSDPTIVGMRLPVLRETRMPAVV